MSKQGKTYLAIAIATIVFIFLMRVWPYQIIKNPSTNVHANVTATEETDFLSTRVAVSQMFVTAGDYIKKIQIECNTYRLDKSESVFAVLLDENKEAVYEEVISVKKIRKDGTLTLKPETDCTYGRLYTLELYLAGENSSITVKTADAALLGQTEYTEISQFMKDFDSQSCMLANYTYMAACTPVRMAFYYVAAIVGGVALWFLIVFAAKTLLAKEKLYAALIFSAKLVLTLALAGGYMFGFYQAAVKNIFGGQIYDRVIHGIGISVLLVFLLCCLWKRRKGSVTEEKAGGALKTWINYLQVVAVGLLLHCCVLYQNAAILYDQQTNLEWAGILLGIVILLQQVEKTIENGIKWCDNKKRLRNETSVTNLSKQQKMLTVFLGIQFILFVVLLAAVIYASRGYCLSHNADADSLYLAKLICWKNGIWAVIILHTILYFRMRVLKTLSIPYVLVWAFFAIWLWTHQYEYTYLKYVPVYFSLLMLQNFSHEDFMRLLKNVMNGMILAFFINLTLSLLYRPYQRWIFFRYPMYFHTVACTGEFLVAARAAVLAKFIMKVKNGPMKNGFSELFLLGVIWEYQLLSMSRTAMMSSVFLVIAGIVLFRVIYHKNGKQLIGMILSFVLTSIILFPTVFSATRIVPALVGKPYRFPIYMEQEYQYGIEEGDPIDDRDYMVFIRFLMCYMPRFDFPDFIEDWVNEKYKDIARLDRNYGQPVYVAGSSMMPSFALGYSMEAATGEKEEEAYEISNGRFEIWQAYIKDLNLTGHEELSVTDENGEVMIHAHNSFLQMAHSFGIIGGVAFLIVCILALVWSVINVLRAGKDEQSCIKYEGYMIPLLFIVGFGVASLTEWLSSMMIPVSMLFWLSIAILSRKPEISDERKKLRTVQKNI